MIVERTATWECHVCPPDDQVLRRGPNYVDGPAAEAGLRHHILTEHAAVLWSWDGAVSFGQVLTFVPL